MKNNTNLKSALVGFSLLALAAGAVYAAGAGGGADDAFADVYDLLVSWTTGTLGKIIAVGALLVGIGFGLVRQSVVAAVIGIAMSLVLSYGPDVIDGIFGATATADAVAGATAISNGLAVTVSALPL